MKKLISVFVALIVIMALAFSGFLQIVNANQQTNNNPGPDTPTPTLVTSEGVADGDWSSGTGDSVNLSKLTPPKSYMKLLGEGIEITKSEKICHPFRGASYGWSGSIYQWNNGKWTKMTSYFSWVPDTEGTLMICTYGKAGGIYALFGAYNASVNPTATFTSTATPTRTPTPKPTSRPPGGGPTQMSRA